VKKPSDLTREQLVAIVEQIQQLLYQDLNGAGKAFWNPEKIWDSATIEYVAAVLVEAGLVPLEDSV
jgi:hypothetical protein